MRKLFLSILFSLALIVPAVGVQRIINDPGGMVHQYYEKYRIYAEENIKIVVDGYCFSACAMMLGIVPDANICSTKFGVFGFHSAYYIHPKTGEPTFAAQPTLEMWRLLPQRVKDKLTALGFDPAINYPDILLIPGEELVQDCDKVDW